MREQEEIGYSLQTVEGRAATQNKCRTVASHSHGTIQRHRQVVTLEQTASHERFSNLMHPHSPHADNHPTVNPSTGNKLLLSEAEEGAVDAGGASDNQDTTSKRPVPPWCPHTAIVYPPYCLSAPIRTDSAPSQPDMTVRCSLVAPSIHARDPTRPTTPRQVIHRDYQRTSFGVKRRQTSHDEQTNKGMVPASDGRSYRRSWTNASSTVGRSPDEPDVERSAGGMSGG
jgi:hypothetical protein